MVGHPFNPPYLIPLVEIVGGRRTDEAAVAWAEKFYTRTGKVCLTMDHEVPGFVGNRLQEALWREALHMIDSGQATVQQIDDAIAYGPGLRWAQMGPMLTFHLAGGQGGMAHMLDHFGPALLEPWTRLNAPAAHPRLRDLVVTGVGESVGDVTVQRAGSGARRVPRRPAAAEGKAPPCLTRPGRRAVCAVHGPRSARSGSTTTATCMTPATPSC